MTDILLLFNSTAQKRIPFAVNGEFPDVWKNEYYKTYPRFPQIELPTPIEIQKPLDQVIRNRKSVRKYTSQSINLQTLSTLLFYSAGIICLPQRRTYPSAGARYPLEVYITILKSSDISSGTYHYNVQTHSLERLPVEISRDILSKDVMEGSNGEMITTATAVIYLSAVFQRTHIKYGNAAFRYICMEAGHVMQNIYLVSESLECGCCAVGGFIDRKANNLLNLDSLKERILYMGILGRL